MAIHMPDIILEFKKLATTISTRSALGNVILLMRDTTSTNTLAIYRTQADAVSDAAAYTAANAQYIADAFDGGAATVTVIRISDDINASLDLIVAHALIGWITVCTGSTADCSALAAWTKAKETLHNGHSQYYGIVFDAAAPNCQHVINFVNETVSFADGREAVSGSAFLPTLAGMLASCGVTSGCTYMVCDALTGIADIAEAERSDTLAAGKLFLFADGDIIRIANGINSCTDANVDDDFRYIDTTVALDMIYTDIVTMWKSNYIGKYRNTLDNQMLLIAAINSYFDALEAEAILDSSYENAADIDVSAQRSAWIASGKTDAASWTDENVKIKTYRRNVYLSGNIRLMGTMENIKFSINLD